MAYIIQGFRTLIIDNHTVVIVVLTSLNQKIVEAINALDRSIFVFT